MFAANPKITAAPCLQIPRVLYYDLDKPGTNFSKLSVKDYLIRSPLYVMSRAQQSTGAQFVVNGLFGNSDMASQVRILLFTKKKETLDYCNHVID